MPRKILYFYFSSCTREALERKSRQRWPKRWEFSECRQGIFRMPAFGHAFSYPRLGMILWKFRVTHAWIEMFRFSNASSRVENASSDLRMPFQGFYKCFSLELEMLPKLLRMLLEELEMLLTLWECFSNNWKCFSRFENVFRRIENASHALRMLFEELKMLLTLWECFSKNWKCFSRFENAFRRIENASFLVPL